MKISKEIRQQIERALPNWTFRLSLALDDNYGNVLRVRVSSMPYNPNANKHQSYVDEAIIHKIVADNCTSGQDVVIDSSIVIYS